MNNNRLVDYREEIWNGYTLEELRYQRAMTLARTEMEKQNLIQSIELVKESMPIIGGSRNGLMGKLLGSLSYLDYAMMAFRVVRSVSKLFHRHK